MESTFEFLTDHLAKQSVQFAIVFVIALIASRLLRGASAHCRYLLWCVVLAKCLTPPLFQLPVALLPADPSKTATELAVARHVNDSLAAPRTTPNVANTDLGDAESSGPEAIATPAPEQSLTAALPFLQKLGLRGWLAITWMLVAISLVILVFTRMLTTHWRLRKSRMPIDEETRRVVVDVMSRLRMRTLPQVYFVEGHTQPFVWGWLRGDIYLTRAFLTSTTREQQEAILAHELAHVARWDLAINLIQMLTSAVFFFHPLVWIANKKIRQEREKCCDEIALAGSASQANLYCETIVDLLASEFQQQPVPGLAMTGSVRNIEERITTILTSKRNFRRGPTRRTLALACLSAACLLPTAWVLTSRAAGPESNISEEAVDWKKGQVVHVTVVHAETNDPIPGVQLETQFEGKNIDFSKTETKNTDADGKATLSLPDLPAKSMRIYPAKTGLVPLRCFWEGEPILKNPKTVTIRMRDGESIGGFVRDEDGEPIANAEIKMEYWGPGAGKSPHLRANITWNNPVCNRQMPKTDKDGKWQFDMMPDEIDLNRLYIYLKHPDFVSDRPTRGYNPRPLAKKPSWEELRSLTSEMVMKRGKTVRGRVVDKNGMPIASAKVFYNNQLRGALPYENPIAECDENGAFRVGGLMPIDPPAQNDAFALRARPGKAKGWGLTFEAKGYAPNYVNVTDEKLDHTVTLAPGKRLRGQVVDSDGNPVQKVQVSAESWRGEKRKFRRVTKTDTDGRFTLTDLPEDDVQYDIGRRGYMMIEGHVMSPDVAFHKIALEKPLTIRGKVVDAETGEPLEKFTFVEGGEYDDGRAPDWRAYTKKFIRNGRYEAEFKQVGFLYRVRVEADGYLPAESPILNPDDASKRNLTHDFKLKRAKPITGTVLGLNDKPLKGAKVYMARQRMNLKNRKVTSVEQWDRLFATTDDGGGFSFPPEIEPFCFVVVHKDGLGMVTEKDFAKSPEITIEEWNTENHQQQIIRRPTENQYVSFPLPEGVSAEGSDF